MADFPPAVVFLAGAVLVAVTRGHLRRAILLLTPLLWPESRPFGPYYWIDEDAQETDDRPVDAWSRPGG